MPEQTRESLEKYLMNLLSRGAYTRLELERKLAQRTGDTAVIAALLDTFEDAGYVDDALYARLFVESHLDWSRRRLMDELQRRGISRGAARLMVDEMVDEEVELERIYELAHDWLNQGIETHRIAGRLLRRGFPQGAVTRVFDELEGECLEDLEG